MLGSASTTDREFLAGLRTRAQEGAFTWREDASDPEVAELVRTSTAMVYAGELEGYGLPPLEALHMGVPVLTSRTLPSLEAVGREGLVLLDRFDADSVAAAMAFAAEPANQERLRTGARASSTPTWRQFNARLAAWLERGLDRSPGSAPSGGTAS